MAKEDQYRPHRLKPLSRGLRSSRQGNLVEDGAAIRANNIDFTGDSLASARGSVKIGNRAAPEPAIQTRIDPGCSPLYVETGKSVPLRGYVYLPYDDKTDLGGDFAASGSVPTQTFHQRRGRSFEFSFRFRMPRDTALYEREHRGKGAPAVGAGEAAIEGKIGFDEGFEDTTILVQKGGDRTTPMSWAFGIVNTGRGFEYVTAESAASSARASNYQPVFMWFDSAEWAEGDQTRMRYSMTNPSTAGASGQYSTQALRALVGTFGFLPGAEYSVAVQVQLDSASVSGSSWNNDGFVKFIIKQDELLTATLTYTDSAGGGTFSGLNVWKGPTDSARYLAKYGVRYSGRDPMFLGLGYRMAPWNEQGFIPFGSDSASMERGGFRMVDRSAHSRDDIYGVGNYTLLIDSHAGADTYVSLNTNRGFVDNNANLSQRPTGPSGAVWAGLGAGAFNAADPASDFNIQALRHYRVVFPSQAGGVSGGIMNILQYEEIAAGDYRLTLQDANLLPVFAGGRAFLLQAFRWNQRDVVIQDFRIYSSPRTYTDGRTLFSFRSSIDFEDETEPDLDRLLAYWPLSDAGGRTCRELIRGKDGFLCPFGMGVSERGTRGKNAIFLSGEGERLVLDLSENPVFEREFRNVMQHDKAGFAVEVTCVMPEAYYGIDFFDSAKVGREYEAKYTPWIASWSVKNADEAGQSSAAKPLLTLGHHAYWATATTTMPIRRPMGFHLDVYAGSDQQASEMTTAVNGITIGGGSPLWSSLAPWVGKTITLQFGIQPSDANRAGTAGKAREYLVYLAATPKDALKPEDGDPANAEFAYFATAVVAKKDLPRLVVTIGGLWRPDEARGYTEYSCRMIVDEVRVFGTTAPGVLPATTGLVSSARNGKLRGSNSLPQRSLATDDILQPVGPGLGVMDLTEGLSSQGAPGQIAFWPNDPEDNYRSVREKYLLPVSDTHVVPDKETLASEVREFYFINSTSADLMSMTLATPYAAPSGSNVSARAFSLVGYTDFSGADDDPGRNVLTIGSGDPYKPGTTKTKDLVLSGNYFANPCPTESAWKVAIASPLTQGGAGDVLPRWTRGLGTPRRNAILGVHGVGDTIFGTGRGAAFKVDDRWRDEGPTPGLLSSLSFLSQRRPGHDVLFPLAQDFVYFPISANNAWPYFSTSLYSGYTWVWDVWVKPRSLGPLNAIGWCGSAGTDPQILPGASAHQKATGWVLRLNRGRPEFGRTSAATYDGTNQPEDGLFLATSADKVRTGEFTHIRVYVRHENNAGLEIAKIPRIHINGRPSSVSVNATDNAVSAADDWMIAVNGGGLQAQGDSRNTLFVGAAVDAYRVPADPNVFTTLILSGRETQADRLAGFLHSLDGEIADFVVWRALNSDASVNNYPSFNPRTIDYSTKLVRFRARFQEGVGYKVKDSVSEPQNVAYQNVPGIIMSHPAIDVWNELGLSTQKTSFAAYENRLLMANGGRPVYATEDRAGPAGILAPTTTPTFSIEKKPLWEPNNRTTTSNEFNDPVEAAAVGSGSQINHFSTFGNGFMVEQYHPEMEWSKTSGGTFDVLGIKGYWQPRDVIGAVPLWSRRSSLDSGSVFIESVDGRARVGWYDSYLKKRVYVETGKAVFRPGYYYYVYLRKAYPPQDEQEGNWLNSFYSAGTRFRANLTVGVAGWAVGNQIQNGGATKKGIVTKVTAGKIEYVQYLGAAFGASEAVNNTLGATGTINPSGSPFHLAGDALVIREFNKSAFASSNPTATGTFFAKTTVRNCISFTSNMPQPSGTTATGCVTIKGNLYTGAAGGVVNSTMASVFHADMIGMMWQWGTGAGDSTIYYINAVPSATQITVVDRIGTVPNFSAGAYATKEGGVFTGVNLVKSDGFDSSKQPDQATHDIEFMGSLLALDPQNGLAPLSAKFDSFGWVVIGSSTYTDVLLFESGGAARPDDIEIGTDQFTNAIYSTGGVGPDRLHFDGGFAFAEVHGQTYAGVDDPSTQPNEELKVALGPSSSVNAAELRWSFLQIPDTANGRRRIGVVFRDRDQDCRSRLSPILVVDPSAEDLANPSGNTRILLKNVPISWQPGTVEREVYMTTAGGRAMFLVATLPDNVSTSVALTMDDREVIRGLPLVYDDNAPPDCSVVGVSQSMAFYGDVKLGGTRQRNVIFYSKPGFPVSVPFRNFIPLVMGKNQEITNLQNLRGRLIAFKRDAMMSIVAKQGASFPQEISTNVGCVGPQAAVVMDGAIYWASERGFYVNNGSGDPVWVSESIDDVFSDQLASQTGIDVDQRYLADASIAVARETNQVVLAFRSEQETWFNRRVALEFDSEESGAATRLLPAAFRHGLYEGPAVTALGSVARKGRGSQHFIGGTHDGHFVYLHRGDTPVHLAKTDAELWNPTSVTLAAGSTTTKLVLSASSQYIDDAEGIRGAGLRWVTGSTEVFARALYADPTNIWLDRPVAAAPASGTVVSIGAIRHLWSSGWIDAGTPYLTKKWHYINIAMVPQASGTIRLRVYSDFGASQQLRVNGVNVAYADLSLTQAIHRIPLAEVRAKFLRFEFWDFAPTVGNAFEITEITLGVEDQDPH